MNVDKTHAHVDFSVSCMNAIATGLDQYQCYNRVTFVLPVLEPFCVKEYMIMVLLE